MGLLMGGLATGFSVAIMMANAGGSWDNAKKYVESGQFGGKGSENHKATVVGDTVGDPFKDTSGPSLNILIKLMSMVAVVVAGLTVSYSPSVQFYLGFNPASSRYKTEFKKLQEAGVVKFPSLVEKKQKEITTSSIFLEDPLMKTEDIIKSEDEEKLIKDSNAKPVKPEVKKTENKTQKDRPKVSGSFGGGFNDTKPAKPKAKPVAGSFGAGFEDEKPARTEVKPTTGGFSSGFDDEVNQNKKKRSPKLLFQQQTTLT